MAKQKSAKQRLLESLDSDDVLAVAMRERIHSEPSELHRKAACEVAGLEDEALLPRFRSLAQLFVWVRSVKAARGNNEAWSDFADRFEPKPSRPTTVVNTNIGPGAGDAPPQASTSNEELLSAADYYGELHEPTKH